jgi:hypothetical protein
MIYSKVTKDELAFGELLTEFQWNRPFNAKNLDAELLETDEVYGILVALRCGFIPMREHGICTNIGEAMLCHGYEDMWHSIEHDTGKILQRLCHRWLQEYDFRYIEKACPKTSAMLMYPVELSPNLYQTEPKFYEDGRHRRLLRCHWREGFLAARRIALLEYMILNWREAWANYDRD